MDGKSNKLTGTRVAEIEMLLCKHPAVREAVVILFEESREDRLLVAYIIPTEKAPTELPTLLRSYLSAALPKYMARAAFMKLWSLPLTANGELDWEALPPPEADAYVRLAYDAHRGEVESTLAQIWGELLGLEQVSRNDNFFALGGNSLVATQVISRMKERFETTVALRHIFDFPTIAELSLHVCRSGPTASATEASHVASADSGLI